MSGAVLGAIVPGLPHPLLCPQRNEGWTQIRRGFEEARELIRARSPDLILIYSTMWPSVIGHQIQADPAPRWIHVDELFHDLGSIPYEFRIDAEYSRAFCRAAKRRGLAARTVAYHGFPIDTGSVVALTLLDPGNEIPASIVSSNMYSDRAETIVLGKAAADALAEQDKTAAVVVVMTLSNRLFTEFIRPEEDRIHSLKDDEWNRKILEFFEAGRLEDVAQLSREIHRQIRVRKVVNFKPMWWLSAVLGAHNDYEGKVHAYAPIYGTGGAVVTLVPSTSGVGQKEFDEEDVEEFHGDRNVIEPDEGGESRSALSGEEEGEAEAGPAREIPTGNGREEVIEASAAPRPVGAYPHARRVGDLLFLSGIGPRMPLSDEIPGGPVTNRDGTPREYDVRAQTRQVIENVRTILAAAGSQLEDVFDVTVFLIDMKRDFAAFNEIYGEVFEGIGATRTTVDVEALPTPIAVELKVIARARTKDLS